MPQNQYEVSPSVLEEHPARWKYILVAFLVLLLIAAALFFWLRSKNSGRLSDKEKTQVITGLQTEMEYAPALSDERRAEVVDVVRGSTEEKTPLTPEQKAAIINGQ